MDGDPHPIVKRKSNLIAKHSKAVREAQKQLREAIRAAERDYVTEEQLDA